MAVIAILAAMLLPALNRAKLAAENTVCRSNLGLTMYVGDFKAYPLYVSPGTNGVWVQKLQPYVADKCSPDTFNLESGRPTGANPRGVYACPGYNRVGGVYWSSQQGGGTGAYGYSANGGSVEGSIDPYEEVQVLPLGQGDGGRLAHTRPRAMPSW